MAKTYTVKAHFSKPFTEQDRLREERIDNLSTLVRQALTAGDGVEFKSLTRELHAAVQSRTPEALRHLAKQRDAAKGGAT